MSKLKGKSREVGEAVERELLKGILKIVRSAKKNCPVDTGRLRASITHRMENEGTNNPSAVEGTSVEYARAVEYGTSTQSPQPHHQPAYYEHIMDINRDIANAVRRVIRS